MRHRAIRWTLLILLGLVLPIGPAAAITQDDAGERYEDPQGRFSVPIPAGWTAEHADGYGILTAPEGKITFSVLALEAADPTAAIDAAWAVVEPDFAMEPLDVSPVPSPTGSGEAVVITYDIGDQSGEVVQGLAIVMDGTGYVMLIRADLIAAQERAAQVNLIVTGLEIAGVEQVSIAGARPRALDAALAGELDTYIVEMMDALDVPGATIAIVQDGEVVYRSAFGVSALGGDTPLTPETRMMIGSTTKPMTTMFLATLVDAGVIAWDTPVVEILPSFAVSDPELTPRITVADLVCACTGVPRRDLELIFAFNELTAQDIIASLGTFEFFTPVGEAFQYSNQMVATGGYAGAAAVQGEEGDLRDAYIAEMETRLLAPMGMADSTFAFEEVIAAGDHATPHGLTLDGEYVAIPLDLERFAVPIAPSGGLWSNVDDMSRYLMTLLAGGVAPDGTRVVSAERLADTWEPRVPVDATTSYGLGWFVEDYKGQPLMHHGGNTLGFTSDLAFMPEAGVGVVVLTNGQGATLFTQAVRYRLLELLFDLEPEIEGQIAAILEGEAAAPEADAGVAVPATPVATPQAVDPAVVAPFLGEWENEALGRVTLELVDGELYLDAGEFRTALLELPAGLQGMSISLFVTADPPLAGMRVTLRIDPPGVPAMVIGEGVSAYPFAWLDGPVASPVASPVAAGQGG